MTEQSETFGTRLAALRAAAGLSMHQLGSRAGLTGQTICNLEAGAAPSWDTVRRLAAVLGVSVTVFEVGPVELPEQKPPMKRGRRPKQN